MAWAQTMTNESAPQSVKPVVGSLDNGETVADRIERYKAVNHVKAHYLLAFASSGTCQFCGAAFLSPPDQPA